MMSNKVAVLYLGCQTLYAHFYDISSILNLRQVSCRITRGLNMRHGLCRFYQNLDNAIWETLELHVLSRFSAYGSEGKFNEYLISCLMISHALSYSDTGARTVKIQKGRGWGGRNLK